MIRNILLLLICIACYLILMKVRILIGMQEIEDHKQNQKIEWFDTVPFDHECFCDCPERDAPADCRMICPCPKG